MWANLNSSVSQGGGFLNDTQTEAAKQNQQRCQNIVPLMIKHLTEAESTELTLWGREIRIVSIVGLVRKCDQATTKLSYDIEDETGTIQAIQWLDAESTASEELIEINTYVKVYGMLREQSGTRYLLLLSIRPLMELNELTTHLLEVIYVSLIAQRRANKSDKPVESQHVLDDQGQAMSQSSETDPNGGMTTEQIAVYKIVQAENHTDCGIERSQVKAKLPENMISCADSVLEFLVCEGHIYTTRTDDHFKTT